MKSKIPLVFFLCITAFYAPAQSIRIDAPDLGFYVSGQTIQFAIDRESRNIDGFLKVELQDGKEQTVYTLLIDLIEDGNTFELEIPNSVISGTYLMKFYFVTRTETIEIENHWVPVLNIDTFKMDTCDSLDLNDEIALNTYKNEADPIEIRGQITDETDRPIPDALVILQFRGDSEGFLYTTSNSDGYFSYSTPLYGNLDVLFSSFQFPAAKISLIITPYPNQNSWEKEWEPRPFPLQFTSSKLIKEALIVDRFTMKEKRDSVDWQRDHNYSTIVKLEEFISLPSTEETLKELLPLSKVKDKKKKKSIVLLNNFNKMYNKNEPLYLIDGLRVPTVMEIFELPPERLKYLKVEFTPIAGSLFNLYGRYARYGILNIETIKYDYLPKGSTLYQWRCFLN